MNTVPIFVDVADRRPLIVGATDVAAHRVRRLADRARHVDVAADALTDAFAELAASGKVRRVAAEPGATAIRGRPLVISASGDLNEDSRVSAIARALGVPVNVPGRPELSTFALDDPDAEGNRPRRRLAEAGSSVVAQASRPARVLLVGAGPGDPDLLTMRAVRALATADVILYDELVDRAVLDHARPETRLIHVGKRGGRPSWKQADIHAAILEQAAEGRTIVRLKGGDPFVFGRGGEEIAAIRAAGLEVEVIPGITAAVAAAASTQVPLTHRDLSRTVTFLSGAGPGHGLPDFAHIDLEALSDGHHTLAVYMGVRTAGDLGRSLIAAGWAADTPVLAIEHAARACERRVRATIRDLADRSEALGLTSPAILLVGRVAGLPVHGALDVLASEIEADPPRRTLAPLTIPKAPARESAYA